MDVTLPSIVSYVISELPSSLLNRKNKFRNGTMLGLLNIQWPPKFHMTFGCWKVVTVLSFCVVFIMNFVDRNSNGSYKEGGVFCGIFPHAASLSHSSDNGNLLWILGTYGCLTPLVKWISHGWIWYHNNMKLTWQLLINIWLTHTSLFHIFIF